MTDSATTSTSASTEPRRGRILDGRAFAAQMRAEVEERVSRFVADGHRPPGLRVVLVGENPASMSYVGMKTRASQTAGIDGETIHLPTDTSEKELLTVLEELDGDEAVDGILVQLPLPDHLAEAERRVLEFLDPDKDVDGFHPENVGRLWSGQDTLVPATPAGIVEMLERDGFEFKGQRAVVVGRSNIVGKPMAALLLARHCTVTICHSRTRDLPAVCREADLLVAAVGRPALLGADAVKPGAVVVDVGTNRIDDRETVERLYPDNEERLATFDEKGFILVGDVDFTRARENASAITPVPGGVGPLTVAHLLVNTLKAYRKRMKL